MITTFKYAGTDAPKTYAHAFNTYAGITDSVAKRRRSSQIKEVLEENVKMNDISP